MKNYWTQKHTIRRFYANPIKLDIDLLTPDLILVTFKGNRDGVGCMPHHLYEQTPTMWRAIGLIVKVKGKSGYFFEREESESDFDAFMVNRITKRVEAVEW